MNTFQITAGKIFSHDTPSVAIVTGQELANRFYSQRQFDRVWADLEGQGHAYYCGPDDIEMRITVVS